MTLGEYLSASRPVWDWANHDCCRWMDRWCMERGRESAIALLGLRYRTERGALLTIRRGGGLVALWTRGMALTGAPAVDEPQAGDVGIIERPTVCGLNETAAIHTGERWFSISDTSIHSGPARALAMWRP